MSDDVHKEFEEYKTLVADTSKLSDRRQTVSDLFFGANSLFLTAAGFAAVSSHLATWWATGVCGAITLVTLVLNRTWIQLLLRYRALINVRVRYLEALEAKMQVDGLFEPVEVASEDGKSKMQINRGVYLFEQKELYNGGSKVGFFALERRFVYIFVLAYLFLTIAVGGLTYLVVNNYLPPLAL